MEDIKMIEKTNNFIENNEVKAAISKLLYTLDYEQYQKQKEFLMQFDTEEATSLLDLLDCISDIYKEATGRQLNNHFEIIEQCQDFFAMLHSANVRGLTIREFISSISENKIPYAENFMFYIVYYKNIKLIIADSTNGITALKPIFATEESVDNTNYEKVKWTPLTEEEMEATNMRGVEK